MLDLLKSFRRQRAALSSTLDGLDQMRAQIDAKKEEIVRVQRAPRPVEDALAAFDGWCDAAATAAVDRVGIEHMIQPGNLGAIQMPIVRLRGEAAPDLTSAVETLLGLLILTNRTQLRAVIAGQLGDLTGGRETLTEDQREDRIETLTGERLALELAEERLIRELETAGLLVSRRPDAPALALLAADDALPS